MESGVISVNCSGDSRLFPSSYTNVKTLVFDDIEWDNPTARELILFTELHAYEVIDFLFRHDQSKDLIVHCYAGISRSGAIGNFARELFKYDYQEFMDDNSQIVPNTHVGQVLRRVWQEEYGGRFPE